MDLANQHYLVLAVVLLQTIGLFHQKSDQRVSSNIYHGMLVTVSIDATYQDKNVLISFYLDDTPSRDYQPHRFLGL